MASNVAAPPPRPAPTRPTIAASEPSRNIVHDTFLATDWYESALKIQNSPTLPASIISDPKAPIAATRRHARSRTTSVHPAA